MEESEKFSYLQAVMRKYMTGVQSEQLIPVIATLLDFSQAESEEAQRHAAQSGAWFSALGTYMK